MTIVVIDVTGVGPKTAEYLAQHGITTVEALLQAGLGILIAAPGFSDGRARKVMDAAATLIVDGEAVTEKLNKPKKLKKSKKSKKPALTGKKKVKSEKKKKDKTGKKGDKKKEKVSKKKKDKKKASKDKTVNKKKGKKKGKKKSKT